MEQLQALWRTNRPPPEVPVEWLRLLEKLIDVSPNPAKPGKR